MAVYRIHIRPRGGANNPAISFQYCLEHNVLGMGWAVPGPVHLTWNQYVAAATNHYGPGGFQGPCYMHDNIQVNDLIWTRDTMGCYYLGRVVGPWEYLATAEARQADIVNICHCELDDDPVAADDVPGRVVASFRAPRTIQAIRSETVAIYSQLLWNDISGNQQYAVNLQGMDIYDLLDDQETENAVAIYLQMHGWLYLPASRQPDTMGYEYILINREEPFERAVVQVKTGNTTQLNRDDFADFTETVFLFQSYGNYVGAQYPHVECIDPEDLREFLFNNRDILPQSIRRWVDYLDPPPAP